MNMDKIDKLDQLADAVDEKLCDLIEKGELKDLKENLGNISSELSERYSISITLNLEIFDNVRNKSISLVKNGFNCVGHETPYQITSSCSSYHTYIVKGERLKVPHDYCPQCWGDWDFKLDNGKCPECGIQLGKDIFLLLDTDVCPNCEEGNVTHNNPICEKCGYNVDTEMIRWG